MFKYGLLKTFHELYYFTFYLICQQKTVQKNMCVLDFRLHIELESEFYNLVNYGIEYACLVITETRDLKVSG